VTTDKIMNHVFQADGVYYLTSSGMRGSRGCEGINTEAILDKKMHRENLSRMYQSRTV
jgi:hypothetical protein